MGFAVLSGVLLAGCGGARPAAEEEPERGALGEHAVARPEAVEGRAPLRGRDPTPAEARTLREAMRIAERLRALRFERPVAVRVQSRSEITAFVHDGLEEDELEEARTFYVAIGLLPPDVALRALVLDVMGEQIAGFYDPKRHTMVVREDVMEELTRVVARGGELLSTPSSMVLVHEYVHALQDQRLGLRQDEAHERTIDEANAYAALVEGDATLTMLGVAFLDGRGRSLSDLTGAPGLLRSQLSDSAETGPPDSALARAPAILRAPLMSRYLDGLVFAGSLHGGHDRPSPAGFAAIDAAFAAPPTTTEQVLHPARFAAGDTPAPLALPALASMTTAGFVALDDETVGELELSVYFARGTSRDRDRDAAAGWDGDRLRVFHRATDTAPVAGPTMAFAWLTRWDDEQEAIEAEASARRVASLPEGPAGPVTVTRLGRTMAITAGLDEPGMREIDASLRGL